MYIYIYALRTNDVCVCVCVPSHPKVLAHAVAAKEYRSKQKITTKQLYTPMIFIGAHTLTAERCIRMNIGVYAYGRIYTHIHNNSIEMIYIRVIASMCEHI